MKIKISPETLKALYFMIGVIIAGFSINYKKVAKKAYGFNREMN